MASPAAVLVREVLVTRGGMSAGEIEQATRLSQPSVSRALKELASAVVRLGSRRNAQWWALLPLYGVAPTQPIRLIAEDGSARDWGAVHHLARGAILLAGPSSWLEERDLPWPLAPLRREGFLGRIAAESAALHAVLGTTVEHWSPAAHLFAAVVAGRDLPGALVAGNPPDAPTIDARLPAADRNALYEKTVGDILRVAPGSSAGGEQPKFTALSARGHLIVKYSPPRGTPFGTRWNDLLRSEAAALAVLGEAGEPVATTQLVEGPTRTFLESERFDRVGLTGRRHVVSLDAIHQAFVPSSRQHWADTCEKLVAQERMSSKDLAHVRRWRAFGRLIANTDMHFGNVSLLVTDFALGRFKLAPCYDMLPMIYRPTSHEGDLGPSPFSPPAPMPDDFAVWADAKALATRFWLRVAEDGGCSAQWRAVCRENGNRVAAS